MPELRESPVESLCRLPAEAIRRRTPTEMPIFVEDEAGANGLKEVATTTDEDATPSGSSPLDGFLLTQKRLASSSAAEVVARLRRESSDGNDAPSVQDEVPSSPLDGFLCAQKRRRCFPEWRPTSEANGFLTLLEGAPLEQLPETAVVEPAKAD